MNSTQNLETEYKEDIIKSIDFIKKSASNGVSWEQVKNEYRTYYLQQLHSTTKFDTMAGVDVAPGALFDNNNIKNDADMLYEALAISFANISPITDAIKSDNKKLFDCIMKYYAQDAIQDKKVLKYAVQANDGFYLKRIAENLSQKGHSEDSLSEIFDILLRCKHSDVAHRVEMILDIFPDAHTYKDIDGKNLLMLAVQAHNKDICRVLTDRGFDPFRSSDQHCFDTIYGYAYEQSLKHPKNKALQMIVDDFKQKTNTIQPDYRKWIEERAKTSIKNQRADMQRIMSVSAIGLISLLALYKCHYKKADSQLLPLNEPRKILSTPDEMLKAAYKDTQNQLMR